MAAKGLNGISGLGVKKKWGKDERHGGRLRQRGRTEGEASIRKVKSGFKVRSGTS